MRILTEQINARLTPELLDETRDAAESQELTLAEYVRRVIAARNAALREINLESA